jgi:hypothetical protein
MMFAGQRQPGGRLAHSIIPKKYGLPNPRKTISPPTRATLPAAIKLATRCERVRAAIHVALVGAGLQNVQPKKDAAILF